MNTKKSIKTYLKIFAILIILIIPVLLLLYYFTKLETNDMSDYVSLICSISSYIPTVILGIIAIIQTNKSNELNDKLIELNNREYIPIFSIVNVNDLKIKNCSNQNENIINFCNIDSTPQECYGMTFDIVNHSNYPINQVKVKHSYISKKTNREETEEESLKVNIAPHKKVTIRICDCQNYYAYGNKHEFTVTCKNIFDKTFSFDL